MPNAKHKEAARHALVPVHIRKARQMKNRLLSASIAAVAILAVAPALAGAFRDAEQQLRDAYGTYRLALFATNSGNAEAAAKAMAAFDVKWSALRDAWSASAPPQYEDDAGLVETLARVDAILDRAIGQAHSGELPGAHLTLEAIRDEVGDLHLRNGLYTFSDRMNAYHAKMEEMLERDYDAAGERALLALAADAAVLSALAEDLAAHPAPEAGQPEFEALLADLLASVKALREAVESGDVAAAKAATGKLKVPFSKLFVKYG